MTKTKILTDEKDPILESEQEDFEKILKGVQSIQGYVEKNANHIAEIKSREDRIIADIESGKNQIKTQNETIVAWKADLKQEIQDQLAANPFNDGVSSKEVKEAEKEKVREGVMKIIRKNWGGLTAEERDFMTTKTMTAENDQQAGYLKLPPFMEKEIIDQAARETSKLRNLAKVVTISTHEYHVPSVTAHGVASWVADGDTTSEDTTFATGKEVIPVNEATALYKIKQTLLDDAAYNIESEMTSEYSEAFGLLEGTAFVSGSGIGQPEGIITNSTVLANYVASGASDTLTSDGLISLWVAPKTIYTNAPGTGWLMNRATYAICAKLKDGEGNYLLGPLANLPQFQILGFPVIEMPDMPTVTTNTYSIVFGNIKKAYTIVNRVGMRLIRDPFASKTTRVVEFMGDWRVGGGVTNAEAIKVQKTSAS